MIEQTELENEILSSVCTECRRGHYRRGETEVEFRRVYDRIVNVEFTVSGVPALICDECRKELILPGVEEQIWKQVSMVENSREFRELIEKAKQLLRRTEVKRSTQSFDLIYAY